MSYPILLASSHANISKQRSTSKTLLALGLVILGICAFPLTLLFPDDSILDMAMLVIGVVLILYGCFSLFWKSQMMIYRPTGSRVAERSMYFDLKHKGALLNMIENGKFPQEEIPQSATSGGLRLDVLYSLDHKLIGVQLFEFVPYTYTALTAPHFITEKPSSQWWQVLFGK